jgi:hypothetical protein
VTQRWDEPIDLTDFEWRMIEPLLPNKLRGVPRVDDRHLLNGIFCRSRPKGDVPAAKSRPQQRTDG